MTHGVRRLLVALVALAGCGPEGPPPDPFAVAEEAAWRAVNRSHAGTDGIFVQAELRTFAYEVASAYARAAADGLSQEQLEYRLRQLVHSYVDGSYPVADGTDINNVFYQYMVFVNPSFDPDNPIQKQVFDNWRAEFVRRVVERIYEPGKPVLRGVYDERWGLTLFSRLVFIVYLKNEAGGPPVSIADVGAQTYLVDGAGHRYAPSGNHGPYLYETDRPAVDQLRDEAVYRVVFPNRQPDRVTPIVAPEADLVALEIHGLGSVPVRRLEWRLPLDYPELPSRRLPRETERPRYAP